MGWGFRYHIPFATALAMRGATDEAAAMLAALDMPTSLSEAGLRAQPGARMGGSRAGRHHRGDHHVALGCRDRSGQGTIRSRGSVSADRCPVRGPIVCTPAEPTRIDRRGPRVRLAARFAGALAGGDGAQLAAMSAEFEEIGDLIAAVDASASGDRLAGKTTGISAGMLDTRRGICGTMRRRGHPRASRGQPTAAADRARIRDAVLLGEGSSSRDVAQRLSLFAARSKVTYTGR